jgi:hypothetical protein
VLGLFRPLEEHVDPSILTVGALCFAALLDRLLKSCLEFVYIQIQFVGRDVSIVICILGKKYLDLPYF